MSFITFHHEHGAFFYAKSHSYLLTVYVNCVYESFQFFSIFANSLMSSMYIRRVIFTCDPLSLYPAVHFLCMWLSGTTSIMNCKCDSESPWKIPLWIFVSAKLLSTTVSYTLQVIMVFSMKFITSCDILYISRLCIIQLRGTISYASL